MKIIVRGILKYWTSDGGKIVQATQRIILEID